MIVGANQDGDNAEGSVITNPTTSTPSVELTPNVSNALGWNWCMCTFTGALGKTPTFTFPKSSFDDLRGFQVGAGPITNPYFSYDQINWFAFDNRSLDGVTGDLICAHNSVFTGDTVQIALNRPYTWTRIRYLLDNVWGVHPWVFETASSIAEGESEFVMLTTPADTDTSTAARPIPAQEQCGFKIAHPNFTGPFKRNLVISTGMHVGEYMGHEMFTKFVDHLLNADSGSSDVRYQNAYEVLKYYDVYCYPMINQSSYVSVNRNYEGALSSEYDFGSSWDIAHSVIHRPFRDRVETDIGSLADAVIDFHSTKGAASSEHFYQSGTRLDDFNGDDAQWFSFYGTRRYWYDKYLREIDANHVKKDSNNTGALRQYSRDNWGTKLAITLEIGQDGALTETDSDNAAKAAMHMLRKLAENGRTNIPRKNAPQRIFV